MRTYEPAYEPGPATSLATPKPPRVNWWLRLTSSGWDKPQRTIHEREIARRSRLTSWLVLGLLVTDALLILTIAGDMATLLAVAVAAFGLLTAAMFNRLGFVTVAGIFLVMIVGGAIMAVILSNHPGLTSNMLPVYDLLAIAVVVGASVLPRWASFGVAALNIAFIALDFNLQHRTPDLQAIVDAYGAVSIIVRPIALQVILALVAFLWVRGTDDAIRRADRAEELAAMEHQLVEQKRQLDVGIRQILETHVRVANGDFGARAPLTQDNILFQIAMSLNNLLNRLGRAAQAEHFLQRTIAEIGRLRESLIAARAGRAPLWPTRTGTPVDSLIEILSEPTPGRPGPSARLPAVEPSNWPRDVTSGTLAAPTRDDLSSPWGTPPASRMPSGGGYVAPASGPPDRPEPGFGPASGSGSPPQSASWPMSDMAPLPDWLQTDDPNKAE